MIKTMFFIAIIRDGLKVDTNHIFDPRTPQDPISKFHTIYTVEGLKLVNIHQSRQHTMYNV